MVAAALGTLQKNKKRHNNARDTHTHTLTHIRRSIIFYYLANFRV